MSEPVDRPTRWWRTRWARGGLSLAVVALIFGFCFPKIANDGAVWETITDMTLLELSTLAAVAIWNLISYWPMRPGVGDEAGDGRRRRVERLRQIGPARRRPRPARRQRRGRRPTGRGGGDRRGRPDDGHRVVRPAAAQRLLGRRRGPLDGHGGVGVAADPAPSPRHRAGRQGGGVRRRGHRPAVAPLAAGHRHVAGQPPVAVRGAGAGAAPRRGGQRGGQLAAGARRRLVRPPRVGDPDHAGRGWAWSSWGSPPPSAPGCPSRRATRSSPPCSCTAP
jgi:hypothetical protein